MLYIKIQLQSSFGSVEEDFYTYRKPHVKSGEKRSSGVREDI